MLHRGFPRKARAASVGLVILLGGALTAPTGAMADEGGVSFWIPGFFGSLAAAPLQPASTQVDNICTLRGKFHITHKPSPPDAAAHCGVFRLLRTERKASRVHHGPGMRLQK